MVKKWKNVPKDKDIIKKLYKTKKEEYPDLAKLKQEREREVIEQNKKKARLEAEAKNKQEAEWKAEKQKWNDAVYDFMDSGEMTSNQDNVDFDDFM